MQEHTTATSTTTKRVTNKDLATINYNKTGYKQRLSNE